MFVLAEQGAAIGGRAAPLAEAVAAAAALLRRAACPLIAGLRTDAAGAAAAAALARRLDAILDHAESAAVLRELSAMRSVGLVATTPPAARACADFVLLIEDDAAPTGPDIVARFGLDRPPTLAAPQTTRRVVRLAPGADLAARLGLLRALIKRRAVAAPAALIALADDLRSARYGVAVWSATRLDALTVEMLHGLIADLNTVTRFAGLPLPADGNAAGVAQALTAATGFPCRVGFRNGVPHHDPWQYDATRLVENGEADAVLWLDALGEGAPPWVGRVKLIALAPLGARFAVAPDIAIATGRPGLDHAAVLFDPAVAALRAFNPAAPAPVETAAALLDRIAAALPPC